MGIKATGRCFVKQESGLVVDEAGNKLPAKSVTFSRMTLFIIIKEGDIGNFPGGKMEAVCQVEYQFFEFFKGQGKGLQVERNQSIIASVI